MNNIILASASPRRKEIMELMGIDFIVRPSRCEEIMTQKEPELLVMELSRQKAENVAKSAKPKDIVIGSDTIVVLDDCILGKPTDRDHAFQMLKSMAGRTHRVYTGVTILKISVPQIQKVTFAECTEVHVSPMTDEEINQYLDKDEYRDKAGAYGIQGSFAPFVTGINGDYYNVMGLPAAALYQQLKSFY